MKSPDWRHESEVRYIAKLDKGDIFINNINNSIKAVIICMPAFKDDMYCDSTQYKIMEKIIDKDKIFRYRTSLGMKCLMRGTEIIWPEMPINSIFNLPLYSNDTR